MTELNHQQRLNFVKHRISAAKDSCDHELIPDGQIAMVCSKCSRMISPEVHFSLAATLKALATCVDVAVDFRGYICDMDYFNGGITGSFKVTKAKWDLEQDDVNNQSEAMIEFLFHALK